MKSPADTPPDTRPPPPLPPAWLAAGPADTPERLALCSGVLLTLLDPLLGHPARAAPVSALANRLALEAAVATASLQGRAARAADVRDAWHFAPRGGARGPNGDLLAFWRHAAQLRWASRDGAAELAHLVGSDLGPGIEGWRRIGRVHARARGPLAGAVAVLRAVLEVDGRAERVACLLADIALAEAVNWSSPLPVSARALTRARSRDLLANRPGAEQAVQLGLLEGLGDTLRQARDLTHRAAALQTAARRLRAKGAAAAVAVFLAEDAVAPAAMLSPRIQGTTLPMTDRAARRFCDRLVDLGLVRELTGRTSFRLYGL